MSIGDLASWVGIIIQTVAIIGTMGLFLFRMNTEVKILVQRLIQIEKQTEYRLIAVDSKLERLSQVVVDLAKQDQRLNNVEARVQELSSRLHAHVRKNETE